MIENGTIVGGKYEILKKIGQGGMSIVYVAMDTRLNKQWAVKEIKKLDREIIVEMIDQIWVYENRKIKIVYNFSDELEKIFEHNVDLRN